MNRSLQSVLLGTAIGDSLGLPAENLPPRRIQRRWPGPWSQRFVFGRGMVSDDTEHTVFVAQCLAEGAVDASSFQRKLAWKLRWWLLCIPVGIGFATLRAILKLWLGFSPSHSGVFSAGNGPAMRSALIGAFFAGDSTKIRDYVRASTRLTHTDPKAETAALAVALTASWSVVGSPPERDDLDEIRGHWISAGSDDADWINLVQKIVQASNRQLTVADFAQELGLKKGVSGYAYHTVPVALYAWLKHYGDYRAGLEAVLNCGGDTDTVGAITGALLAINGTIPDDWSAGLCDYPISQAYLEELALALQSPTDEERGKIPTFPWVALPFRNLVFLMVVVAHVCRRIIP
jgi:ADP-ribosyl-[dinitrogen reductase] hydrolase